MQHIAFIVFRQMRAPLLVLIAAYSIAILGFTLIPGERADGTPWRMDFFHAFYFVSFMSTTIGFGEIPLPFSPLQRAWTTVSIYFTVIAWLYSIGKLLTLIQDPVLREEMRRRRFCGSVARLREPFYLVCGHGETGAALVRALTGRNQRVVAIDLRAETVNPVVLEDLRQYVPAFCADATIPRNLLDAGLARAVCAGVVALTNDNEANLKIAITAKLLHPRIKVVCRADSNEVERNMASFGTDHIIDPFHAFAQHLATALESPYLHRMHEWLTDERLEAPRAPVSPPATGLWIVCGFGRFGKALHRRLLKQGFEVIVIEATPEATGEPPGDWVVGWGTDAETLQRAQIERAVGLVAGTDNDANNLSIIMTARELNKDLFVIARQNLAHNRELFAAVDAQMVMHPSSIVANRVRTLLATPMLHEFEKQGYFEDDDWAFAVLSRLTLLAGNARPEVWELAIAGAEGDPVNLLMRAGAAPNVGHLLRDPHNRDQQLAAMALLLQREGGSLITLPPDATPLKRGDRLLVGGRASARYRMLWTLQNPQALSYIVTGESPAQGWLWRTLFDRAR